MKPLFHVYKKWPVLLLMLSMLLTACQPASAAITPSPSTTRAAPAPSSYNDASVPVEARVKDLLGRMTLAEKIGQMTQVEKNSIQPDGVTRFLLGSILSGGGGSPAQNDASHWLEMTNAYQQAALQTRLGIPLIYGADAVHGHNNLMGAVIYPQQIGLGAAADTALVKRIGRATAEEMQATGVQWDFAPVLAVPQDIRWGRTYEGYSENTALVSQLGAAFIHGLQGEKLSDPASALATAKHFIGDGGTTFGSSTSNGYLIDQGDMRVDEATLRAEFLPPYQAALEAGALSAMASFSSWNGEKMHAQKHLLTDVLKGELGFKGFVVSDWGGIDQISPDYNQAVITAVNAGVDMAMTPYDASRFINALTRAVNDGKVPQARIDDAVSRILYAKFKLGLFEHPLGNRNLMAKVGSPEHRQLGREAVARSLVLLQNDRQTLPLAKNVAVIFVAGQGANDIGMQCGGWTIEWQGQSGDITAATSLLKGITNTAAGSKVLYDPSGDFKGDGTPSKADVGIVVVGEMPYAEGVGDSQNPALTQSDVDLIGKMRVRSQKLVVIILSGRPLIITDVLSKADAWVAAWLPGTEGQGVADVLFGDQPFRGKLPYTWPRSSGQIPIHSSQAGNGPSAALFPYGFGLSAP